MTREEQEHYNRMFRQLENIESAARTLEELHDIAHALFEAATMPSDKARRTIMRTVAFRLDDLAGIVDDIREHAETGLNAPEAEHAEEYSEN